MGLLSLQALRPLPFGVFLGKAPEWCGLKPGFWPKLRVLKNLEAKILKIKMLFRALRGIPFGALCRCSMFNYRIAIGEQ
jgi:hypothetical protein